MDIKKKQIIITPPWIKASVLIRFFSYQRAVLSITSDASRVFRWNVLVVMLCDVCALLKMAVPQATSARVTSVVWITIQLYSWKVTVLVRSSREK